MKNMHKIHLFFNQWPELGPPTSNLSVYCIVFSNDIFVKKTYSYIKSNDISKCIKNPTLFDLNLKIIGDEINYLEKKIKSGPNYVST